MLCKYKLHHSHSFSNNVIILDFFHWNIIGEFNRVERKKSRLYKSPALLSRLDVDEVLPPLSYPLPTSQSENI